VTVSDPRSPVILARSARDGDEHSHHGGERQYVTCWHHDFKLWQLTRTRQWFSAPPRTARLPMTWGFGAPRARVPCWSSRSRSVPAGGIPRWEPHAGAVLLTERRTPGGSPRAARRAPTGAARAGGRRRCAGHGARSAPPWSSTSSTGKSGNWL